MPGTLEFCVGAWGVDDPVRQMTPYLRPARRPRIHHARDYKVLRGGLGSG